MRARFLFMTSSLILALGLLAGVADSAEPRQEKLPVPPKSSDSLADLAQRQRLLQIAKIELRLYERVEHPTRIRRLETEAKLARAEHESAVRLFRKYDSYHRSKYSNPFLVTLESARLAVTETKLRLDELKQEKCLAVQFHPDRLRLFQLRVEAAEEALKAVSEKR